MIRRFSRKSLLDEEVPATCIVLKATGQQEMRLGGEGGGRDKISAEDKGLESTLVEEKQLVCFLDHL